MTDVNHAKRERAALCDLLTTLGPDQPTLCAGWQTRDLAAHLVVRDRRPVAALGIVLPPLAAYTARVQAGLAGQPFDRLIDMVRRPPRWSPASHRPLEPVLNTMEMFIHHEDARRGQPDWRPRELAPELAGALWSRARGLARLRLRRFPGAVTLALPGHGEVTAGRGKVTAGNGEITAGRGKVTAGRGDQAVRLTGEPGELVLFLSGRYPAVAVELTGPDQLTDRLRRWRLGL